MPDKATKGGIAIQHMPSGAIRSAVDRGGPIVTGKLRLRRLSYVVVDQDDYATTSTVFVPVPDVEVHFKVKGEGWSDVVAEFSAMSFGSGLEVVFVRARLDGTEASIPSEVQFSGADDAAEQGFLSRSHACQFVFPQVQSGRHSITAEFHGFAGEEVFIHRPCLVVAHP